MKKKEIVASIENLATRVRQLECNQTGHKWHLSTFTHPEGKPEESRYIFRCRLCGTSRITNADEMTEKELEAAGVLGFE